MSRPGVAFGVVFGVVVAQQLGGCVTSIFAAIAQPKCLYSPGVQP